MGFKLTLSDPDAWLKPATALDGLKYYTQILVYVDDIQRYQEVYGYSSAVWTRSPDSTDLGIKGSK